jgi:tetratricopeptide (TPR) repeat protein
MFLRGRISLELGDQNRALSDFKEGARLNGDDAQSVARVLGLYVRLDRSAAGVAYFESLSESPADSPAVASRYARLLAGADRGDQAVTQFRKAMTLAMTQAPDVVPTVIEDLQGAFSSPDAIPLFEAEPAGEVERRANGRLLVRLYARASRYDDAVSRLEALVASATDDQERGALLHEKGDILQLAGDTDGAIAAYEEALALRGESWVTLNNVAYLLSDKKRDDSRALPYARRAVALAENAFTLDTLGWIYVGLEQYQEAIAELSQAIRLNPGYAWAYYHLGEAYRRSGQFTEASGILGSGLDVARASGDSQLVGLFEASTEKARNRDDAA